MAVSEVVINNKLKKLYQEYGGYQELNEADQGFFDQVFTILWVNDEINLTNKYLGERFGYSNSTIEKKLRRLERAGLIIRFINRFYEKNKWNTNRKINLDPNVKMLIMKGLNRLPKSIEEESVPKPAVATEVEQEEPVNVVSEPFNFKFKNKREVKGL